MSRKKAEETVAGLTAWISERDRLNDYEEYRNGHQVNRASLIAEGVLKRSQLSINGNPRLRKLLADAESRWYRDLGQKDYHKESHEAEEEFYRRHLEELRRLQDAFARTQAELAPLKAEVVSLRAENTQLRSDLGVHTFRDLSVIENYRGLPGWD